MVLRSYEMLRIVMMCLSAQFEITLWQSYHNFLRSKMRMGHGPLKGGKMLKFKDTLNKLLSKKVDVGTMSEQIQKLCDGKKITLLEAVLISQINKAIGGDNTAAAFLRDTSGNKLKDATPTDNVVKVKFEDL